MDRPDIQTLVHGDEVAELLGVEGADTGQEANQGGDVDWDKAGSRRDAYKAGNDTGAEANDLGKDM